MTAKALQEGMKAPDFTALTTGGGKVSLSDFKGKIIVLYFYPRDNTPGCTREACGFQDALSRIKRLGAVVLGVSKDSLKSHEGFAEKYGLRFPLLSDPEKKIIQAYGVWKEKKMYGKTSLGVERSTFLIDEEGIVRKIWRKVKVDGHDEEVLQAIKELS